MKDQKFVNVVSLVEKYFSQYIHFQNSQYAFVAALWAVATHFVENFESIPYMVITALTRQSGKTLLMELIKWVSANPFDATGVTASALYRTIDEKMPTVFVDESESLNRESNPLRPFLNVGYRMGQTIPRTMGKEVKEYKTFGFKCFTLIGGVYATLKDRSIIIFMRRASMQERAKLNNYRQSIAISEGESIREQISQEKDAGAMYDIQSSYLDNQLATFLSGVMSSRDAEIWHSLFAVCKIFCPERYNELVRAAVDMASEKSQEMARESKEAEKAAEDDEFKIRLLRDMISICNDKGIRSVELLPKLYAIDIAPWRKYKGNGISIDEVGRLMQLIGVKSKAMRFGKGRNGKVERGYAKSDLLKAADASNLSSLI